MKFKALFVFTACAAALASEAQAQLGAPIGKPDHRPVVSKLTRALPPSVSGDYVGVTPQGRWCAMTVSSNGWEFYAATKVAVPGTPWSFGRPTVTTDAASYSLTMNINTKRVTSMSQGRDGVLTVSYEQIPVPGVNMQYMERATIKISPNQYGRPSRVEIDQVILDTWNDYAYSRSISCGEPLQF